MKQSKPTGSTPSRITKTHAIVLAQRFLREKLVHVRWYQQSQSHIKAILLYGSVAKGANRPDSDIDLLIIMPLAVEEKYTKGEYVYDYQDYKINIVIRSIERLRKIAAEQKDAFQKEVFREAVILSAAGNEVERLMAAIATD